METVRRILDSSETRGKKEVRGSLEKKVVHASIAVLIVAGLFFLSPTFTGNAIGELARTNSNFIGIGLIAMGLIVGFLGLRKR